MKILALIVAIALPAATAWTIVERAFREPGGELPSRLLRLGLALPLGLGGASLLTYAWLLGGGTLGPAYAAADAAVFGGATLAARRWRAVPASSGPSAAITATERFAIALAAIVLAVVVARFVQITLTEPHGEWDAWAIWNQRARFLFRAGDEWRTALDPALDYSHPEYPLLLPTVVARLWAYSGETTVAPALAAAVFTFAPVLVVAGAVARRAGWLVGATAVVFVVAARTWVGSGASQYADVPVACLVAAAVGAALAARRADATGLGAYALAGAFLGLAAWTKDEGVVLAAVFGTWAALSSRRVVPRVLALGAGAAAPLAARALFQLTQAPGFARVFTAGQTGRSSLERVLDPARWEVILSEVPPHLPGAEVALPLLAVVAAISLGARRRGLAGSPVLPALVSVAAFLLVYAATPLDLSWHIGNSASRVLLQPWPAFILGLFHLVGPRAPGPGEVEHANAPAPPTPPGGAGSETSAER